MSIQENGMMTNGLNLNLVMANGCITDRVITTRVMTDSATAGRSVLAFDDWPAPIGALRDILKTLGYYDWRAEFLYIGSEVEDYSQKTKMIVREGHDIQDHSWSYVNWQLRARSRCNLL